MSLLDLLFVGILLWLVLRAAGRAAERGRRTGEGAPEGPGRRSGPPQRPRQPPRLELEVEPAAGESEARRVVLDELRRWEEEQRRREVELERRRTAELERPPPPPAPPRPLRQAPVAATLPGGEARPLEVARPRRRPAGLPALAGYSPLRRAVLYTEILGPPRALREQEAAGGPLGRSSWA